MSAGFRGNVAPLRYTSLQVFTTGEPGYEPCDETVTSTRSIHHLNRSDCRCSSDPAIRRNATERAACNYSNFGSGFQQGIEQVLGTP